MDFFTNKKGISPVIAVVLLIGFTVAVGAVLINWLGSLSGSHMEKTSEIADKQLKCSRSVFNIERVKFGNVTNVTVSYTHGTENLYDFTITFIDNTADFHNVPVLNMTPQYNDSAGQRFTPGMTAVWNIDTNSLRGTSLDSVHLSALCQKDYPISTECKSGQNCMG